MEGRTQRGRGRPGSSFVVMERVCPSIVVTGKCMHVMTVHGTTHIHTETYTYTHTYTQKNPTSVALYHQLLGFNITLCFYL